MAWLYRQGAKVLLFVLHYHQLIQGLNCWCSTTTCLMRNVDLHEDYASTFSCLSDTTSELSAMFVKGVVFDLTTLPNLRHFALDVSQLDSVIVSLTANKSSVSVTATPLRTIIFHNSHNLVDVRMDSTLLATIPDTLFVQELLKVLFITNSLLTVVSDELFEKLPNLEFLNLSFNMIHVVHIPATCCKRLVKLDLDQNMLADFNFGLVSHMNCLESLTLGKNRLMKIENNEANGKFQNLSQHCTTVTHNLTTMQDDQDTAPDIRFASLETIILESNRLREVNLSMFGNMPKLTNLLIGKNLLSNITVPAGPTALRLKRLDLSFNQLANVDLSGFFFAKTIDITGNER